MEKDLTTSIALSPDASIQTKQAVNDGAGFPLRLYARLPHGALMMAPMERAAVPTGVTIALPDLIEAQVVAPRSWHQEHPLSILNSPGTIDPDYRGEVHVLLINLSALPTVVEHGQEIAELRLASFVRASFEEVEAFEPTARGKNGLGSTGTN